MGRKKTTTEKICLMCGESFYKPHWQAKKMKFCSLSCSTSFRMNKTNFGKRVRERIQSKEVRAKANSTYRSEEYRKKRSIISKETSNRPHVKSKSKDTMLKLHEKIHNDPNWKKETSKRAVKLISENKIGTSSKYKQGYYKDTNIFLRSSYEFEVAEKLDAMGITWEYEKKFTMGNNYILTDFIVGNTVLEVRPKRRVDQKLKDKIEFYKTLGMNAMIITEKEINNLQAIVGGL